MKLLLAIDVHDQTRAVFDHAAGWVRRLNATLDLIYVNAFGAYLPYLHSQTLTVELSEELDKIRSQEESQLSELMGELPEENRGTVHVIPGSPAATILELAPSYDALLVGTHGRTGFAHLWMGSLAEQIVRRSPIPVIVLRLGGLE